ncbi:uncharacterized protein LOC112568187 isoform X4 [Pomacea canaliculata]|uniref:uncharacterized protein LOC112568187 isoform X4 n=1 Tax=Pomacea canaliculata TaxID=400727 RepID=UPI000D73542F|nr:uncharacterized protein LOC112568187 isoform X4 [Pomacea canaliculata]
MADKSLRYYLLLVLVRSTQGNITSECSTGDSYWEVQEGKTNNIFTCTGMSTQDTIQWYSWYNNTRVSNRGSCPPRTSEGSPFVCDTRGEPVFIISRTSDDTGVMVINATAARDSSLFDKGQLQCHAYQQGMKVGEDGCRLDYIRENISCTVEFKSDTWTVYGQCGIQKVYSAQNRYRCEWIQLKEVTKGETLLANISMTVVPLVDKYVSGWCNFTSHLPPPGQYTYHVTVTPGEVTVNASFIGNNEIRRPLSTLYHNCPQYIRPGDCLSCTCFADDLGSPPGVVVWNTTHSAELRLTGVQVVDNGTHVCQSFWNNTVVRSVEYFVQIGNSPNVLTFSLNNVASKTVNVDEKSQVEMKCSSYGKPTPSIGLVNVADPSTLLNQSQPTGGIFEHSKEVTYSIHQVLCEASGVYRCDTNNSIGQDSQSRTLLVSCAPKRADGDEKPQTVQVTNGVGVLKIKMMVYPTPELNIITYLGMNDSSDGYPVKENNVYAACSTTLLSPASVTCNVIVINMTHNDEGFYRIVFSNSLGDLPFTFYVKVSEDDQQACVITKTDENIAGVVVLAVMLSVVAVLIVVVIIWVWRRGWTLPCAVADGTNHTNTQQNQRNSDASGQSSAPKIMDATGVVGRAAGLYDALRMEDVGKQSHYQEIRQDQNASKTSYEVVNSPTRKRREEPTYMN